MQRMQGAPRARRLPPARLARRSEAGAFPSARRMGSCARLYNTFIAPAFVTIIPLTPIRCKQIANASSPSQQQPRALLCTMACRTTTISAAPKTSTTSWGMEYTICCEFASPPTERASRRVLARPVTASLHACAMVDAHPLQAQPLHAPGTIHRLAQHSPPPLPSPSPQTQTQPRPSACLTS